MKLVIDMNLSPTWVGFLTSRGFEATHWSTVGAPAAPDAAIMAWARNHNCIVFTHDLDFSTMLAHASALGPSLVQVRTQAVLPEDIGNDVADVLHRHADALVRGAIVTIDEVSSRVRILPIGRDSRGERPA